MRRYESVVIIGAEMTDDDIRSFAERYGEIIKNGNGEVIKLDDWGVKRLAYHVKKQEKGRYILFDYLGQPELVTELERKFRISEEVMKFITVKIEDQVDPEALKARMRAEREAQEKPAQEAATQDSQPQETEQPEPPAEESAPEPVEEAAEEKNVAQGAKSQATESPEAPATDQPTEADVPGESQTQDSAEVKKEGGE